MSWKTVIQVSVAAIVGAGIFQVGRMTAIREFLYSDYEGPGLIPDAKPHSEMIHTKAPAKKSSAQRQVEATPQKAEVEVPKTKRKKYADPPLIPRDREMVALAETLATKNDLTNALSFAQSALRASRPEVREAAVTMLAWFGKKAIAELTPFLSDKNENVALEASTQWRRIFSNECTDDEKVAISSLVLNKITNYELLEELGIEDMFNQIDEKKAVEAMISVIKGGNAAGVKLVKSSYETVTGSPWKDEETARRWMATKAADSE